MYFDEARIVYKYSAEYIYIRIYRARKGNKLEIIDKISDLFDDRRQAKYKRMREKMISYEQKEKRLLKKAGERW